MHSHEQSFVPALGWRWLTRFYDPMIRLTMREQAFKQQLIDHANIRPGQAVLDVGCGTGTLAIMIKQACPDARVVGVDIDPDVLAIARDKIRRVGAEIELKQANASEIPLPPESFDRAVSSLVLHHLTTPEKKQTLAAVWRVLRPGGEFHVVDFGKPHNALMGVAASLFQHFEEPDRVEANTSGALPALMAEVGFRDAKEVGLRSTLFGTLSFLRATR